MFNFESNSATLEFPEPYCSIFTLPLTEGASEVPECSSLKGRMKHMKFVPSLSYFMTDQSKEQIPVFLTRIPDGEEHVIAISEKARSSFLLGYSIITLYISVILVAGRLIRGFIYGIS